MVGTMALCWFSASYNRAFCPDQDIWLLLCKRSVRNLMFISWCHIGKTYLPVPFSCKYQKLLHYTETMLSTQFDLDSFKQKLSRTRSTKTASNMVISVWTINWILFVLLECNEVTLKSILMARLLFDQLFCVRLMMSLALFSLFFFGNIAFLTLHWRSQGPRGIPVILEKLLGAMNH